MKYAHFFQYNVPADNQFAGRTNFYINVLTTWEGSLNKNGEPIGIYTDVVNPSRYTLISVKDWHLALKDIDAIAEKHFAEIAKQERINQAKAVLINEEVLALA